MTDKSNGEVNWYTKSLIVILTTTIQSLTTSYDTIRCYNWRWDGSYRHQTD